MPNSRFIGIAQVAVVGAPSDPAVVTVREDQSGTSSILEGWALNGASIPSRSRTIAWSTDYRVQAIGSNQAVTYLAGRSALSITAEQISATTLARIGPSTSLATLANDSDAGVTRLNVLSPAIAPVFVWVAGGTVATLHRMETQNTSVSALTSTAMSPGVLRGDEVIDVPLAMGDTRLFATSRCVDACSFLTISSAAMGPFARMLVSQYSPSQASISPPTLFQLIAQPSLGMPAVFDTASPIRAAFDGSTGVFLAGQAAFSTLVVERRDASSLMRTNVFTSDAALRVVDIVRAQNGVGVYVLVNYSQPVTFGPAVLNYTNGHQGNVGIIRIDTVGVSASVFDIPLDQQAVAFAKSGAFLYVAVHEGSNAVLWKIPAP